MNRRAAVWLALAYVAAVLAIDTLAAQNVRVPFPWSHLRWSASCGADLTKFALWFVVPFLLCLRGMDWGYLGVKRWRRIDLVILGLLACVGMAAVISTLAFPSLHATYPGLGKAPAAIKWHYLMQGVAWTLSWLIGWEFLHRYFLLTRLTSAWPKYGWLLIPLSEGAYHLQKPLLEAGGMVLYSVVLTLWAMRRKNALLPFLAHLTIEIELIVFQILV